MTVPRGVCFHGKTRCSFCGPPSLAPWRKGRAPLLSKPTCPGCGTRSKHTALCADCFAHGIIAEPLPLPAA